MIRGPVPPSGVVPATSARPTAKGAPQLSTVGEHPPMTVLSLTHTIS